MALQNHYSHMLSHYTLVVREISIEAWDAAETLHTRLQYLFTRIRVAYIQNRDY
jgi:hypothetical protein